MDRERDADYLPLIKLALVVVSFKEFFHLSILSKLSDL